MNCMNNEQLKQKFMNILNEKSNVKLHSFVVVEGGRCPPHIEEIVSEEEAQRRDDGDLWEPNRHVYIIYVKDIEAQEKWVAAREKMLETSWRQADSNEEYEEFARLEEEAGKEMRILEMDAVKLLKI